MTKSERQFSSEVMKLANYPEYKDSGLPWLGKVPTHWRVIPNRGTFMEVNEQNHPDEEMLSVTISQGVIKQSILLEDSSTKDGSRIDRSSYKLVEAGDIAYNKMRAWQGAIGVSDYRGIISPAYVVQRPRQGNNPNFLHYLLRTPAFAREAERNSYGITSDMWSLRPEHFKIIYSCIPPLEEQIAIVQYLDKAAKQIQAYIRAKQKLISLLEEQRQAVIHQAVTGGLEPNVKLRPSGVEWLGDIPKHWEVRYLGQLGDKFGSGITPRGGAAVYQESGIPILRSQNVHFQGLRLEEVARISRSMHEQMESSHVKPGDVLLNITGASIGRVCTVPQSLQEANVNQHVCIIRPRKDMILNEFLAAYLSTPIMQQEIQLRQSGASREGLTLQAIRSFPVPLPPIEEQDSIANNILRTNNLSFKCRALIESQCELMEEYQTRVIADVVTGKLDVRKAAAELPDLEPTEIID